MNPENTTNERAPWPEAVGLVERWLGHDERADELLERADRRLGGVERARVQHLVFGVIRHHVRVAKILERHMKHAPRDRVLAVLHVAGFELIEALSGPDAAGTVPKVVHHGVEQSKRLVARAEQKLVNAVLRRLSEDLTTQAAPGPLAAAHVLGEYFSHPEWLVKRWLALYGAKPTRSLLEWNQTPATVLVRARRPFAGPVPAGLAPTKWEGFYEVEGGRWREVSPLVEQGILYVQDPSTRVPVDLLAPAAGESVLDLCAAPGGKSIACADRMGTGLIIAVDLPGPRQERLAQNLERIKGVKARRVEADIIHNLAIRLGAAAAPASYDAVLLDAPCSNTGVMRHRVDVKDRLEESDLEQHARQQVRMLGAASGFVKPGGRLVYSTCSIDTDENEVVVKTFLEKASGWELVSQKLSKPWSDGHDGGAAFLLRRKA